MKRRLLLLLLLSTFALSQTTPNLLLNKPPLGAAGGVGGWSDKYNTNFDLLDSFLSGGGILPAFKAAGLTITGSGTVTYPVSRLTSSSQRRRLVVLFSLFL